MLVEMPGRGGGEQSPLGISTNMGENSPPTPHKGYFCKSSKTDKKIFGV